MLKFVVALLTGVFIAVFCTGSAYAENETQSDTGDGLFISADYIYQRLQEGDSGLLKPDWGSGFRVSAGYKIPGTEWDIRSGYTYYRASSDDKVTGTTTVVVIFPPGTYKSIYRAYSKYYLDEAVAEAGYRLHVTDNLHLRMHLGPQYTRIEKQTAHHATDFFPSMFFIYRRYTDYMMYHGYGVRVGADCSYDLGGGFMLASEISGGYLFGTVERYTSIISHRYKIDGDIPFYAANAGIEYDLKLTRTAGLNITIGYEISEYLRLGKQYVTNDRLNYMLHGPYFRARLDF